MSDMYSDMDADTDDDVQRGLYRKFYVRRLNDPMLKHGHCEYFVLDLNCDKFSGPALLAYADACEEEYPELAKDLRDRWTQPE